MRIQISNRGTDVTEELTSRVDSLAAEIRARAGDVELAKFVVEERETIRSVGVVLSWGEQRETVVRHAEATDWDRAFMDLGRRLERALDDDAQPT